ncbi:MAG: aminotransferase class V-fold PLP-dependent enzyme [Spirochaetes bacterium]|nr:aminotransferase class V-fold PLP-dependent enzyme [Spirochaetota bacterium]
MDQIYYMDNNATTRVDPAVLQAMLPYFTEKYSNPSSAYGFAQECRGAVENARKAIASTINSDPDEIVFTSGGTESNNMAIKGIALSHRNKRSHIITSSIEHPAILNPCKYLELNGYDVTCLPVDKTGLVDPEDVKKTINKNTILISVMMVNNEIGTVQPVDEIGKIAKEAGVLFHTDAVQAFGKISIDVKKSNVDMLSLSSHKFHGPKGVGILYIKKGIQFLPIMQGGSHEKHRRAGTLNVPGIVGMGKAVKIASRDMVKNNEHIAGLMNALKEGLLNVMQTIKINGHLEKRVKNTLNFSLKNMRSQDILMMLDDKGFLVSSGSACSSGISEPSYVLRSLGLSKEYLYGTIRISLGKYNTQEEVDSFLEVFPQVVLKLKK